MQCSHQTSCSRHAAEVIFFIFKMAEAILDPSVRLYIYHTICRQLVPELNTCGGGGGGGGEVGGSGGAGDTELENTLQTLSGRYIMLYKVLLNAPVLLIGLFCGAWSDVVGRKPPVVAACAGSMVAALLCMASLLEQAPALPLVLAGAGLRGVFGRSAVVTMALHSHIADTSGTAERTERLGRLLGMNFLGYFVGSLLAGVLLQLASFNAVFTAAVLIYAVCVMLAVLCMHESLPPLPPLSSPPPLSSLPPPLSSLPPPLSSPSPSSSPTPPPPPRSSSLPSPQLLPPHSDAVTPGRLATATPTTASASAAATTVRSLFRLAHVRDSLSVVCRRRAGHDRSYIWFFFVCVIAQQLTKSGEVDITLLFTKRAPLHWSKSMYSYYLAADYAGLGLSVLVLLPLAVRFFRPSDTALVAVSAGFKALRLVVMALANHTWLMYFSVCIGCPSAMLVSSAKSLISKIVGDDEIGKIFSLLSCLESVSNLVGSVIFTGVYTATTTTLAGPAALFPGFTFAVDAAFFGMMVVCIVCVWFDMKKTSKNYLLEESASSKGYGSTNVETVRTQSSLAADEEEEENIGCEPSEELLNSNKSNEMNSVNTAEYEIFNCDNELMPLTEELEPAVEGGQCNETMIGK